MTGESDAAQASERFFTPRRPVTTAVRGEAAIEMMNWHSAVQADPAEFSVELSLVVFDSMAIVRVVHAPSTVVRTPEHVTALAIGSTFYFMLTGSALLQQSDQELPLTPGAVGVVSGYLPYTLRVTEPSEFIFVILRRGALVGRGVPHPETDIRLFPDSSFAASVFAFIAALSADLPRPASPEGTTAQQAVLHLLTGLLLSNLDLPSTGTRQSAWTLHALTYIAANYSDDELSTGRVAQAIGLSVRHLQRVLSDANTSVAAEVRRVRIRWATVFLTQPERQRSSLEEIATLTGFGNLERMRRAFVRDVGMTPAEYRANGPVDEHTGLARR